MQWNRSVNYALAVGHLADRLQGGAPLAGGANAEREALSRDAVVRLQQQLASLGFDAGTADGVVGPRTQGAIWLYQVSHGLPADGYPAPSLATHVQRAHDEAAARGRLVGAPALPVDAN
jgi:membrane-bound lytic murein transglycosylase B